MAALPRKSVMSLSPAMFELIRRAGRKCRECSRRPTPIPEPPTLTCTPASFTACRIWFYRVCLFLPRELFGSSIDLQHARINVRSQFDYDSLYSPEVEQIIRICNEHELAKPGLPKQPCAFHVPWGGWRVVACFNDLLVNRDSARCIKRRFRLNATVRDNCDQVLRVVITSLTV